ncbi:MAG: hypothetical protein HYU71_10205 [Bacteroidetes bacterium]|nr:hypothetical protein [Bacteroidota bacterium]
MKNQGRLILLLGMMGCTIAASAQKGLNGLVEAERAFARFTESHTIRDGFLKFMDTTGLIFQQGKPLNAHQVYQRQKAGPGVLSWAPDFAVISVSGDMGVTSGPYIIRPASLTDTPVARGYFSSIWRINALGAWKNLADLGTASPTAELPVKELLSFGLSGQNLPDRSFTSILLLDSLFNTAIIDRNSQVWEEFLTTETRMTLDRQAPASGEKQVTAALLQAPDGLQLAVIGGGISPAGDFAYTYGVVINGNRKENYLRAWIYRQKEWKLILQTIKW